MTALRNIWRTSGRRSRPNSRPEKNLRDRIKTLEIEARKELRREVDEWIDGELIKRMQELKTREKRKKQG
jgi:hypothetical protein